MGDIPWKVLMEWASTQEDQILALNSQLNGMLELICSLREEERSTANDAKAFQEVI